MNIITSTLWKTGALKLLQNAQHFRIDAQRSFCGILKTCNRPLINNFGCSILKNDSLNLLTPQFPIFSPSCGFKVKGRLKRRCKDCYFVVREGRTYVICETHPRHKQMAIKPPDKSKWMLSHATQSPVRPW